MSYDLGFQADYSSLYQWLDTHQAIECGDSVAFLNLETERPPEEIPQIIQSELEKIGINNRSKARVYLVWRDIKGAIRGKFIIGQRKSPPWAGYAPKPMTEEVG